MPAGRRSSRSVIVGNVTDKEKKAVSGLVEAAVPQRMAGQRAGIEVVRFRTAETTLVVSATGKVPIAMNTQAAIPLITLTRQAPTIARASYAFLRQRAQRTIV